MRTLHFGLRVADLDRSLAFYTAVGYELLGMVPETPFGAPGHAQTSGDEFVTMNSSTMQPKERSTSPLGSATS